jgi:hypothetical protein
MKSYKSLIEALDDLRKRGYDSDFQPQSDCLYCSGLDLRLYEEEFRIDEVYRLEEDANAFVYALTSPTGVKGTVVVGKDSFLDAIDFEKKLQEHPVMKL